MMIEDTIEICRVCGGDVLLDVHMVGAHVAEDNPQEVHLVWTHPTCGVTSEAAISVTDYKAALSWLQRSAGADTPHLLSEGDATLHEFRLELNSVKTPADLGFKDA